jgi:hypothetical protein
MKTPLEILYDTCKEYLSKRPVTLEEFIESCKKDKVLGEGVEAVCQAIIRYNEPYRNEVSNLSGRLQEALVTIRNLEAQLASIKESSEIREYDKTT